MWLRKSNGDDDGDVMLGATSQSFSVGDKDGKKEAQEKESDEERESKRRERKSRGVEPWLGTGKMKATGSFCRVGRLGGFMEY